MSKKATEFQKKEMSKMYRGKEIFKPLNTGWIDGSVACVCEWVANIFFYRKGDTAIMIDAGYLLCQAAFVMPVAVACYKTDGDLKKLRGDTAYLNRVLDANIEGYRAIRDAGHTILPKEDADFEGERYRKTCLRFFKLMCATSLGKLCAADHAMNAIDEMSALNRDLKKFFDENGAAYPTWRALEAEAGRYLQ